MKLSEIVNDRKGSALSTGLYAISGLSAAAGFGLMLGIPGASDKDMPCGIGLILGCYAISAAAYLAGSYIKKHF